MNNLNKETDGLFKYKKLNLEKLLPFGFVENDGKYMYSADILDGQFRMTVVIAEDGTVGTRVIDPALNEEYVLHRASGVSGTFVGMVRADHEKILREISEACFEPHVFKSDCAQKVIQHVRDTYGDELEFLWRRFPGNAIFRRKDTKKWYAALLLLSKRKLGLDSDEIIDILDLRIAAADIGAVVDGVRYFPGYHMNKKHWYTICLDGSVPVEEIARRIDASYELAIR